MATVTAETLATEVVTSEPDGLYEVVDGAVVEKVMGVYEAHIAGRLYSRLGHFVEEHNLGTAEVELLFLVDPETGLKRRPDVRCSLEWRGKSHAASEIALIRISSRFRATRTLK